MLEVHVVISQKLQSEVLEELHCNHPGIVRMKSLARSYCWWGHMDQHIEALVQSTNLFTMSVNQECSFCFTAASTVMA